MEIISLGLGVQSTALYLMSCKGDLPRADYAIFADPGAEHKNTYSTLVWLKDWTAKNDGIPIIVNNDKNLLKDILKGENSSGGRFASIPAFGDSGGLLRRQCTMDYKIKPIIRSARKLHGLTKSKHMKPTEMWIGISIDEASRMKDSRFYNVKYKYPLIDKYLSRTDCAHYFKDHGYPVPGKSSCVFCPYHSDSFWNEIKEENGSAWNIAKRVDYIIRDSSKKGIEDKIYLHRSLKPIDQVNFTKNQLDMFQNECEGYCGL